MAEVTSPVICDTRLDSILTGSAVYYCHQWGMKVDTIWCNEKWAKLISRVKKKKATKSLHPLLLFQNDDFIIQY